jgi:hypothetical protein
MFSTEAIFFPTAIHTLVESANAEPKATEPAVYCLWLLGYNHTVEQLWQHLA